MASTLPGREGGTGSLVGGLLGGLVGGLLGSLVGGLLGSLVGGLVGGLVVVIVERAAEVLGRKYLVRVWPAVR